MSRHIVLLVLPGLFLLACGTTRKPVQPASGDIVISTIPDAPPKMRFDTLQVKYAAYLHVSPDQIRNEKLYRFIDQWMYTPYKWGGTDSKGIDCSAFLQRLLAEVYHIDIPRTSVQQFFDNWIERFGSSKYLSEGDLVFFRTMDDKLISHVGFYLNNHMFVNASSSKGVSIASLDDPYWKRCFVAAGRIRPGAFGNKGKPVAGNR